MHAPRERATMVVTDAFGGGASELVKFLIVLGHGGIVQVAGGGAAQSAELVMRRLKTRVEEGRVKVISVKIVKGKNTQSHTHTQVNRVNVQKSITN